MEWTREQWIPLTTNQLVYMGLPVSTQNRTYEFSGVTHVKPYGCELQWVRSYGS